MKRLKLVVILVTVMQMVLSPLVLTASAEETYTFPHGTRTIETWYTRNEAGMLIGQDGKIVENGVDTDGDTFTTITKLIYEVINGKSVLKTSTTETTSENPDGSWGWFKTIVNYVYDAVGTLIGASGTREGKGREKDILAVVIDSETGEPKMDGDKVVYHKKGGGETTNPDEAEKKEGAYYESKSTLTYAIIEGEAVIVKSVTTTDSWSDDTKKTKVGYSESTTTYEYIILNGTPKVSKTTTDSYSEDYTDVKFKDGKWEEVELGEVAWRYEHLEVNYTYDGGVLTGASGTGSAAGLRYNEVRGWEIYTSTITLQYEMKNGAAFLSYRKEEEYYEAADPPPPPPADPTVTGTLVGKHEFHTGSDEYFGIIKDANGKLWIVRISKDQYKSLTTGSSITVSGDKTDPSDFCYILDNVTIK